MSFAAYLHDDDGENFIVEICANIRQFIFKVFPFFFDKIACLSPPDATTGLKEVKEEKNKMLLGAFLVGEYTFFTSVDIGFGKLIFNIYVLKAKNVNKLGGKLRARFFLLWEKLHSINIARTKEICI